MLSRRYGKEPEVFGLENVPSAPYVVVGNYLDYIEGPLAIINAVPDRMYPLAADVWMDRDKALPQAKKTFTKKYGDSMFVKMGAVAWGNFYPWLLNYTGSIRLPRDDDNRGAVGVKQTYKESADVLLDGRVLAIMPEYRKGEPDENHMWPYQPGAARIIKHALNYLDEVKLVILGVSYKTGNVMFAPYLTITKETFEDDRKGLKLTSRIEDITREMVVEMNG